MRLSNSSKVVSGAGLYSDSSSSPLWLAMPSSVCNDRFSGKILSNTLTEWMLWLNLLPACSKNNLSKKCLEKLSEYLKSVEVFEKTYAYQKDKYYFLENDEIKSDNLENTCGKIKKLLKNHKYYVK